jgi:hypothetical protein
MAMRNAALLYLNNSLCNANNHISNQTTNINPKIGQFSHKRTHNQLGCPAENAQKCTILHYFSFGVGSAKATATK